MSQPIKTKPLNQGKAQRSRGRWAVLAAILGAGCQTPAPLPPVDLTAPGWQVRQGQAIWRPAHGQSDWAGQLMVALHPDGRGWVQYAKTPFPVVTAQKNAEVWQVEMVPLGRTFRGRGSPPARFIWFHLLESFPPRQAPPPWRFRQLDPLLWRLENEDTGESLEGYLSTP